MIVASERYASPSLYRGPKVRDGEKSAVGWRVSCHALWVSKGLQVTRRDEKDSHSSCLGRIVRTFCL